MKQSKESKEYQELKSKAKEHAVSIEKTVAIIKKGDRLIFKAECDVGEDWINIIEFVSHLRQVADVGVS